MKQLNSPLPTAVKSEWVGIQIKQGCEEEPPGVHEVSVVVFKRGILYLK